MTDEAIDQAIFSVLSEIPSHWRKVALVVYKVASAMGNRLAHGDEDAEWQIVANRIEVLVAEGRLIAQGNLKNWRFSEVRLPG